jgi:hypothetical protein
VKNFIENVKNFVTRMFGDKGDAYTTDNCGIVAPLTCGESVLQNRVKICRAELGTEDNYPKASRW